MANTGGRNGSVTVTTTATGSSVTVSYPADPNPPAQVAHEDTYDPCPEPFLGEFRTSKPPLRVRVVVDAEGKPESVKCPG